MIGIARTELEDFLIDGLKICYSATGKELTIFGEESAPLRKNSQQFNMVVVKDEYERLQIDFIAAGGGVGFFNKDSFTESDFVIKMNEKLRAFAADKKLDLEEVSSKF